MRGRPRRRVLGCGGVIEFPSDRLEAILPEVLCPSCSKPIVIPNVGAIRGLKALGMVLATLAQLNGCEFRFVLPWEEE